VRVAVIGAGAWGLPAAAELAERGHRVTLIDRYGPGNEFSSSRGPSRLWRLADPDPMRIRLSRLGLRAMERLSRIAGRPVFDRRGLLWRDSGSHARLIRALEAEDVAHEVVKAPDVGSRFPRLAADERDAVWLEDAGVVLAKLSLDVQLRRLSAASGAVMRAGVLEIETRGIDRIVVLDDGRALPFDRVVVAAGPGASRLLERLGHPIPLRSYLEQVVHFGDPTNLHLTDGLPCIFDGPTRGRAGVYGMPSPGIGYKLGLDTPLRPWSRHDSDRRPDRTRTGLLAAIVGETFGAFIPRVIDEQVCTWTDSPDGRFVIGEPEAGVVIACGDSGEGFKFSALMGIVLADLVEGVAPEADLRPFAFDRFTRDAASTLDVPTSLGAQSASS
jgi:sarcosine oxidase